MERLREAQSDKEYKIAIQLFREYASQIGIDLSFQDFDEEIINIHKQYSRPDGLLLIAYDINENPVGCIGVRRLTDSICELKRMYVKKEVRGQGLGKVLLAKALEIGKQLNYDRMRLDTLVTMNSAIQLYEKAGFYEIDPYRFNPEEGAKYFEIRLTD